MGNKALITRKRKVKEPETSKDVRPDFDSAKGYYWMKQMGALQKQGTPLDSWPRKPRRTKAEKSYFAQVDQRLSRSTYGMGAQIIDGKVIREEGL